jgi:tetratricopeptide (TPR) repeat protein
MKMTTIRAFVCAVMMTLALAQTALSQRSNKPQGQDAEMYLHRAIANLRTAHEQQSDGMGSNYRAAREDLSSVITLAPQYADAYYLRAMTAFVMQDYHAAFGDMQSALKIRNNILQNRPPNMLRNSFESDSFEGMFALAGGQFTKADSLFSRSLFKDNLRPNGALYVYRALAQFGVGRVDAACEDCRRAEMLGEPKAKEVFEQKCLSRSVVLDISFPQSFQFFARDSRDSASVLLSGVVNRMEGDSVYAVVTRNGVAVQRVSMPLVYTPKANSVQASTKNATASKKEPVRLSAGFALTVHIKAECAKYGILLGMRLKNGIDSVVARRDSLVAGDVFLFAGQSNMVLGNVPNSPQAEFMRTYNIEHKTVWWQTMAATNSIPGVLGHLGGLAGETVRQIVETRNVPVCAIHAAVGGTSIEMHLPIRKNPPQGIYDYTLYLAKQSGLAKNIRGIVWYQGESNTGLGYAEKFAALYRAWKLDYPSVQRVYVVQVRPNVCNDFDQSDIREEQRHLQEFFPNVEVIAANAVQGYDGCHFSQQGYEEFAGQVYRLVERDFYDGKDSINISSPNLRKAFFADTSRQTITLEFLPATSQITASSDSLLVNGVYRSLRDAFLLNGRTSEGKSLLDAPGWIDRIEANATNTVRIRLRKGVQAERITYIPSKFYPASSAVYNGPWLITKRGVGVLSFYRAAIQAP